VTFSVQLSKDAQQYLDRLDSTTKGRVVSRVDEVAVDPFSHHTKPLAGRPGVRAARVGGYRIVFAVDVVSKIVKISDIGPRGQVYRGLSS